MVLFFPLKGGNRVLCKVSVVEFSLTPDPSPEANVINFW